MKKAGIMGPFGYGNLGDAAIQEAMIQHLRAYYPGIEIYGFSLNPADTQERHGIPSFPITRMSWAEAEQAPHAVLQRLANWCKKSRYPLLQKMERWLLRLPLEWGLIREAFQHLQGLDRLVISGGGQLDDYWGGGGAWSHPYTLLKWGILAKLRRVKFSFVSVGAGPIDARLSQIFIKYALSLANYRSYRDEQSKQLLKSIGFAKDDPIYPDLAFSLQLPEAAVAGWEKRRPVVGIGPLGYFRAGCWPESDEKEYAAYLVKMVSLTIWLVQRGYALLFLPGEAHYDQLVIEDLVACVKARGIADEQLIRPAILTVADLLAHIETADFLIASRFHNLLLGQALGKPVMAISYQAKIEALMADTGQADYCFPIASFEVATLKERVVQLEANCAQIKQQIGACVQAYRAALDEQYEQLFGKPQPR